VSLSFLGLTLQIFNITKLERKKTFAWLASYQFFFPTHYYYYYYYFNEKNWEFFWIVSYSSFINTTNFAIFWGTKSPNSRYHQKIWKTQKW
jgi:hypothetical protein